MKEPVRVLLFFPEVNEVGEEVEGYFQRAGPADRQGRDRAPRPHGVGAARAEVPGAEGRHRGPHGQRRPTTPPTPGAATDKFGKFDLDTDFDKARRQTGKLRILDQTVNTELLKLVREKRKAYLTVGHAELNDPDSLPVQVPRPLPRRQGVVIKAILGQLNYEVKNLPTIDLNREVPADATLVMALGPKLPVREGELTSLTRYLDRGGRVLVAIDPEGEFELGPLGAYFGVGLDRHIIHDDKNYTPERGQPTDKMLALTNGFSSHPATTALSRGAANQAILLQTSGALIEKDFTVPGEKPKRTIIIRSMSDAWLDLDGNHAFDAPTEKRDRYSVGAAIEGPKPKKPDGTDGEPWRALVFADSDLFADRLFRTLTGQQGLDTNSRTLPDDSIRWLGGEEAFAGIVNTEKENEVRQTKKPAGAVVLATTAVRPGAGGRLGLAYALSYAPPSAAGGRQDGEDVMKGVLIHGALLGVMLVYGYKTWTKDEAAKPTGGEVVMWTRGEADVSKIEFQTDNRLVRLERRGAGADAYWWGTETKTVKKPKPIDARRRRSGRAAARAGVRRRDHHRPSSRSAPRARSW
jgi:hypothetical protein